MATSLSAIPGLGHGALKSPSYGLHPEQHQQLYRNGREISTPNITNDLGGLDEIIEDATNELWEDILETSHFGRAAESPSGLSRLALDGSDKQVRDWFCEKAQRLGLELRIDAVGNMFAILPGLDPTAAPIGLGSHLDTQPQGGRFDGILGVLAGFQVISIVKRTGICTSYPIAVINWTNEEGAKYTSGCTGSAVWSGHTSLPTALAMPWKNGPGTFGGDLDSIGYAGRWPAAASENPLSAHLELHIEQGSRLEETGRRIGIVKGIQGVRWYNVEVKGRRGHAGSTPMEGRADAMVATSRFICFVDQLAREKGAVATVGVVDVADPSSNVIPGFVRFTIDVRHPRTQVLEEIELRLHEKMSETHDVLASHGTQLDFKMERVWNSPAAEFDEGAVGCVRKGAVNTLGSEAARGMLEDMLSFAGHDSALVNLTGIPTAMIFVPSRNGISHSPAEYTEKGQCGDGLKTLLFATLHLDKMLLDRRGIQTSLTEGDMIEENS